MKRITDLGSRLRAHREARGWTQTTLAARAGISPIYVRKLEAGERQAPSLAVSRRIRDVLRTGPDLEVTFPHEGKRAPKRKALACNLCVAVEEMLSGPLQKETDLAAAGLALQNHRARVQDL